MNAERKEAWMRIVILVISGIVLGVWSYLTRILVIINWIIAVFTGKRHKALAEFVEIWNTQMYTFLRYISAVSNKRPFPFSQMEKSISKFEK